MSLFDLDREYPSLSGVVQEVLALNLEQLGLRSPADGFPYYDLERLCGHARALKVAERHILSTQHAAQALGYLHAVDEYVAAGMPKNRRNFVKKKLMAPVVPVGKPDRSEFLDTVAECEWGLWFHEHGFDVEEEVALPLGGDVDFRVRNDDCEFWVDCYSPEPRGIEGSFVGWVVAAVERKWKRKFKASSGVASLSAGISLMLMKANEAMPHLLFEQLTGGLPPAPDVLWRSCPSLQKVWVGCPPFEAKSPRPQIVLDWTRP